MKNIIDVIVVGFERAKETFRTIEALLNANNDIRVILVHDGSIEKPDLSSLDTSKIIEVYLARCGQAKCINTGLKLVKSEYVAVMHNDIIINDKDWIRKAVNFLKTNKDAGLIATMGVAYIYEDPQHFYRQFICSLKGGSTWHKQSLVNIGVKKDFTEVRRTDNVVNIFKTGIKADERYGVCGLSFWMDVAVKGLKCYVMRFKDGEHLRNIKSIHLEAYNKIVPDLKKELEHQGSIIDIRIKELGIHYPKGIDITKEEIRWL